MMTAKYLQEKFEELLFAHQEKLVAFRATKYEARFYVEDDGRVDVEIEVPGCISEHLYYGKAYIFCCLESQDCYDEYTLEDIVNWALQDYDEEETAAFIKIMRGNGTFNEKIIEEIFGDKLDEVRHDLEIDSRREYIQAALDVMDFDDLVEGVNKFLGGKES